MVRKTLDVVGAEGAPPDLVGVVAANGVVFVLVGHLVGGGWPGVCAVELGVVVLNREKEDNTTNTLEAIVTHAGGHGC